MLLLTTQASLDALGEELGGPVYLRRFRTNGRAPRPRCPRPGPSSAWTGGPVGVLQGAVGLAFLLHPCERCAIPTRDPDTQTKWPGLLRHLAATHDQLFGINAGGALALGGRLAAHKDSELLPPSGFCGDRSIRDRLRPDWRTRCFALTRPPGRWSPPKPVALSRRTALTAR